jgi:OmpA-OmpF porin, OOP family
MELTRIRQEVVVASIVMAGLGITSAAFAEDLHGVISEHAADGTLMVLVDDSSEVMVVVADSTRVKRLDGLRSRKVTAAALIPGLRIEVDGTHGDGNRFVAERVTFRKSDMKTARAIQGGIGPTDRRVAADQQRIEQQAEILRQQGQTIQQQAQQIAANDAKIVATAGIAEANAGRISNLDDYNVIGTYTVYFANGKSNVQSKYRHELESMIGQAKDVHAYVVQVQGYASAVGGEALNEQLSTDRAVAVTRVLQENGVPPTNIVPPAGMGTTNQVAPNKTAKGQAENRRAVITLLQNKGIAGK